MTLVEAINLTQVAADLYVDDGRRISKETLEGLNEAARVLSAFKALILGRA